MLQFGFYFAFDSHSGSEVSFLWTMHFASVQISTRKIRFGVCGAVSLCQSCNQDTKKKINHEKQY